MANVATLVTRIKRRLARRSDTSIESEIRDELDAAQERLEDEKTKPWFLLGYQQFDIVGAHEEYNLNAHPSFLRIWDDGHLEVQSLDPDATEWEGTIKEDYEVLRSRALGEGTSESIVTHYALVGNTLVLRPKMIATRTYRLHAYFRDDSLPSQDAETLWSLHAPDLLMCEAGIHLCMGVRDKDAYAYFQQERVKAYGRMIVNETSREMTGTRPAMEK